LPIQTGKTTLIIKDTPINAPAIPRTISGLTLKPLVSSSKNRSNPALDAGRGAFFFLLIIATDIEDTSLLNTFRDCIDCTTSYLSCSKDNEDKEERNYNGDIMMSNQGGSATIVVYFKKASISPYNQLG
jgi:hypothetical protein